MAGQNGPHRRRPAADTGDMPAEHYGPDGMPVGEQKVPRVLKTAKGLEMSQTEQGWFKADSNKAEQDRFAAIHLQRICAAVHERHLMGMCPDERWTNDPEVFPDLHLTGSVTSNPVNPFPPEDDQFFIGRVYDPGFSRLSADAVPSLSLDEHGRSTWLRLVDFAPNALACHLFDKTLPEGQHYGRIVQGSLDNSNFVEALQAIALRPKLAQSLFHCWDERRSVYIARLYKHGTWMRVEVDDYVPLGPPAEDDRTPNAPICCRSEAFPYVLWPSLIEKAYAKIHTVRIGDATEHDRGGWESLGGGGSIEEALSDLTGGVAGRFQTTNVTADRLFIYIHELQRDTLFVCRVNEEMATMHGVALNPYHPNIVNRAVEYEGRLFIQMYSGAPGIYDGGLQDNSIPWSLINHADYPERSAQGFFWITHHDFREYFGTIIECRLTNSNFDTGLKNMPPPRVPGELTLPLGMGPGMMGPGMIRPGMMGPGMMPPGMIPPGMMGPGMPPLAVTQEGDLAMHWYEQVYANAGSITRHNTPEFTVTVPGGSSPCEVVCSVEQMDARLMQQTTERPEYAAVLVKVYEQVSGQYYSQDMVCKSNWIPIRDSMVAFSVKNGGQYKLETMLPSKNTVVNRMVFRCYTNRPGVMVSAVPASMQHMLVTPVEPPKAVKLTLVGFIRQELYENGQVPKGSPEYFDITRDSMRKAEYDLNGGWDELAQEAKKDCVLM